MVVEILMIGAAFFIGMAVIYVVMSKKANEWQKKWEVKHIEYGQLNELYEKEVNKGKALEERMIDLVKKSAALEALKERLMKEKEEEQLWQQHEFELRERQFKTQMEAERKNIELLTQRLLEEQKRSLSEKNEQSMLGITQPLRDIMTEMRDKMEQSAKETQRNRGALEQQLEMLARNSEKIGEKAEGLTQALRGNNKLQGDWGEMILRNLLEVEGLREGQDYELQYRIKDDKGSDVLHTETHTALQPDAILHYPKEQDVVIDAKTSLKSYSNYLQAQTEEEKEVALKQHLKSVRGHIAELSKKDYSSYIQAPRKAIDFVVMFVPNESALQLALAHDKNLWRDAFDKHVLLAGELNLRAILRIIHIIWRQHQQVENEEKVFALAEKLIKRTGMFIERYNQLGRQLKTVTRSYDDGMIKLNGQQGIVGLSNQLKECGVKEDAKYIIPETKETTGLLFHEIEADKE